MTMEKIHMNMSDFPNNPFI